MSSDLNLPEGWIIENGIKYKPATCTNCGRRYYVRSSVRNTLWCPVCRIEHKRRHAREHYHLSRPEKTDDDNRRDCKHCDHLALCQRIVLTATKLPCETDYPLYDARAPEAILSHNNQVAKAMIKGRP